MVIFDLISFLPADGGEMNVEACAESHETDGANKREDVPAVDVPLDCIMVALLGLIGAAHKLDQPEPIAPLSITPEQIA